MRLCDDCGRYRSVVDDVEILRSFRGGGGRRRGGGGALLEIRSSSGEDDGQASMSFNIPNRQPSKGAWVACREKTAGRSW